MVEHAAAQVRESSMCFRSKVKLPPMQGQDGSNRIGDHLDGGTQNLAPALEAPYSSIVSMFLKPLQSPLAIAMLSTGNICAVNKNRDG